MQVLTKVLQLHPKEAGLWSYAAAWEFGDNRNAAGARSLMQQGLRSAAALKAAPRSIDSSCLISARWPATLYNEWRLANLSPE